MLNRSNLVLFALLALQLALLAASVLIAGGSESREIQPLLADIMPADVERLAIADDLDNSMTFARAGDGWVLPEADDFPLNGEQVDEILDKLASLDTRRLVASNPANFARLEVKEDDFRRRIEFVTGDGIATRIFLGGSGGVDTVYVRRAEKNEVYLASGLNSWELSTQVSTWLDAEYVSAPQADLLDIVVSNAQGTFAFQRDGDAWTYAGLGDGDIFEDTRMPVILRNAAGIRLQEPLGLEALAEYGLDAPQAVVDVTYRQSVEAETAADDDSETAGGEEASEEAEIEYAERSYRLRFGAELADGDIVLKSSDADYYVLVRETALNAFKDLKHEDFVKQSEPEPESD